MLRFTKPGVIATLRLLFARQAKGKRKLVLWRLLTAHVPENRWADVKWFEDEECSPAMSVIDLSPTILLSNRQPHDFH
jgi:hypothetical protein